MLRAFVVLLLLANALFLAWTQGWLAPTIAAPRHGQREPERLSMQVRPELVTVVPPKAGNPALAATRAADAAMPICMEAGPFAADEVAAVENVLAQASLPAGSWAREQVARAAPWAVYMGRFSDKDTMRGKADELRRLKVTFEEMNSPPQLAPGLRLTTHADKAAAEAALAELTQRGVRTARVVELPAPPPQTFLRVARADADLQGRLRMLGGVGSGFVPCQRRER